MRKAIAAVAALVLVGAVAATTTWWLTGRDGETEATGTCDTGLYELSAEPEDGAVEVTFELQATTPGETWDVLLEQDGNVLFEGQRSTDVDGELDLDLVVPDADDSVLTVRATGPDGSGCTAELAT